MSDDRIRLSDAIGASLILRPPLLDQLPLRGVIDAWCWRDGRLLWEERGINTVVTVGKNDLITQYFKGSAYTAAFYIGLKDTGSVVAGDTMGSHGGWTENTTYSEGTRQALTMGTASGGSIDNSAAKASFSINGSTTIFGIFITTSSTKGGTTGTLFAGGDFAASRAVASGDILQTQYTLSC